MNEQALQQARSLLAGMKARFDLFTSAAQAAEFLNTLFAKGAMAMGAPVYDGEHWVVWYWARG